MCASQTVCTVHTRKLMCLCVCVFDTLLGASGGSISLPCALGSCHLPLQWEKGRLAQTSIYDLTHSLSHHNLREAGSSRNQPEEGDHSQCTLDCASAKFHQSMMFLYSMYMCVCVCVCVCTWVVVVLLFAKFRISGIFLTE